MNVSFRRATLALFWGALILLIAGHTPAEASIEDCARSGMSSAKRRALLIGIGVYNPEANKSFGGLTYPENDVTKVKELLESPKYNFTVCTLRDGEATRDNILLAIEQHLLKGAKEGDVCLFYFSGHGSWVKNSLSDENDLRDETIAPYDVIRPVRAESELRDIRDKQLAELFNRAIDSKAVVTVILDSCHSGSGARQTEDSPKEIEGTGEDFDLKLAPTDEQKKKPEERGALIISAAQDYQTASGGGYSVAGLEGSYSHLTAALLLALYSTQADLISAEDLFSKVTARLKADGRSQCPVLAGTPERLKQTIFGGPSSASTGRARAAVVKDINGLFLLAGLADGLTDGCDLSRVEPATGAATTPPVHIRIAKAGLTKSTFEILPVAKNGGAARAQPAVSDGDIFEQRSWVAIREPSLKVWLPPANLTEAELAQIAAEVLKLRASGLIELVEDPAEVTPTHILSFGERGGRVGWLLRRQTGEVEAIRPRLTAEAVLGLLEKNKAQRVKLFINMPPSAESRKQIRLGAQANKSAVEIVSSRDAAHYELVGRARTLNNQVTLEYAWMLPAALVGVSNRTVPSKQEGATGLVMPPATCWTGKRTTTCPAQVNNLDLLALRLSKIRGWLKLTSPVAAGGPKFPYRLEVRKVGERIKTTGTLVKGESYNLFLVADPLSLKGFDIWPEFFVYVLDIDANGRSTVLYPTRSGSSGLVSLTKEFAVGKLPGEIQLTKRKVEQIEIFDETDKRQGVLGAEHFVLLVTDEPLPNIGALAFDGVRTRRTVEELKNGKSLNPLAELLLEIGVESQSRVVATPGNWVVDHLTFKSVDRP